jgi:hypothetical protein
VLVGLGTGLVLLGLGTGLVLLGLGTGLVLVGNGVGLVLVGNGVGLVLVGNGVGLVLDGVGVGLGLDGVAVGDADALDVLVGAHPVGALMASSMRVTPPVLASSRPSTVSLDSTEIEAEARMLPTKSDPPSSVAELPTCQKTSQAEAPFSSTKLVARREPTVSMEPTWKTKTGLARFSPFSVTRPSTRSWDEALYMPGVSTVGPEMAPPVMAVAGVSFIAWVYAVVRSAWACALSGRSSSAGGVKLLAVNPITEVPGLTPRSPPLISLGPVLVTSVPPRTA